MTTIDTGTGTQANLAIATAQKQLGTTVPNSKWCANFISSVFKSAGLTSVFTSTSSVPTLVSQFAGKTSTNISTAQPGDLIVFGNNEHVMMYEGSSQVIGTATNSNGVTQVIETNMNNVITDSGKVGPSLVLHTGLDNNIVPAATTANPLQTATVNFGSYLQSKYPAAAATNMPVTQAMIDEWIATEIPVIAHLTGADPASVQSSLENQSAGSVGKPISAIESFFTMNISGTGIVGTTGDVPANPIQQILDILSKFTNPSNWLHLGAMVVGVGLVGFGMWTVTKDLNETGPQGLVSPMPIILKDT